MSERERYQPGVPCWVDTLQPDPDAAMRFYGEVFGWEFAGPGPIPGDPQGGYYVARLRGRDVAGVGSEPEPGATSVTAWATHISVASADEAAERARGAGGAVLVAPFDVPPAGRLAVVADPAGAVFCLWEPQLRHGAMLVNEPSAWAMSLLHSTDPAAAMAFYSEVFGWHAEPLEMAGGEVTLLRLPGCVAGEPQQPVPRDVVAVMVAVDEHGASGDAGSYWSVDFWIDDADAAAAKAADLGGSVIVEPHDTPGFRNAVLTDPAGAMFSISRLLAVP